MHPSPAATELVREWTRAALRLEGGTPVPRVAAERLRVDGDDLLAAVTRHRVVELLAANAASLGLPGGLSDALTKARTLGRRSLLLQVLELGRVASLFSDAGIAWLAVKGPALAVQSAGAFGARGGGDLDVFVSPDSVPEVFRLLTARGWSIRPDGPREPGSWAWRHVLRTYHEMTFDGPTSTIDVHWRLDPTHAALPDFASAWHRRETVDVAGLPVPTLGLADAFSHTCHHAAKDGWRWLRSLVDVHRLARQPQLWVTHRPRPLDTTTLAVTAFCVGLPDGLPAFVGDAVRSASRRPLQRALAAQNRPADAAVPPGTYLLRGLHHRVSASRSPADLRIALVAAALPAELAADLAVRSAWTALPVVVVRRLRRALRTWRAR